jgi:biopolymer transport protein ExbB
MNLQSKLTGLAHMGAEWVMWLLVGLSVVAVTVIIERAIFFLTSRDDARRLSAKLRELLARGDVDEARIELEASPGIEARIAGAALRQLTRDNPTGRGAEESIAAERSTCRLLMEKRLAFLGTLGNNAPFVGLLGTVIGIITAFRELAAGQGQVSAGLMAEIGEALVVTGLGLLVALPAVACFNVFQQLIQRRLERADALSQHILAFLRTRQGES